MIASFNGHADAVQTLIEAKAPINTQQEVCCSYHQKTHCTTRGGRTWSCVRTRLLGHHMTLFTCYSFLVSYIAYFVYVLRLLYIVKQREISGVAGEHPYVKIEQKTHLMLQQYFCL